MLNESPFLRVLSAVVYRLSGECVNRGVKQDNQSDNSFFFNTPLTKLRDRSVRLQATLVLSGRRYHRIYAINHFTLRHLLQYL